MFAKILKLDSFPIISIMVYWANEGGNECVMWYERKPNDTIWEDIRLKNTGSEMKVTICTNDLIGFVTVLISRPNVHWSLHSDGTLKIIDTKNSGGQNEEG